MITVFGKEWFKKYNKQLCWIANSFVGDWIFRISKFGHDKKKYGKITEMHPNAITHFRGMFLNLEKHRLENKYTTQFFSRNEYALRLQKVFYPIWLLFHTWDMLIANKFKPAWNLGFDTLTVYPDAGSGSTTVDGQVVRVSDNETWTNLRTNTGTSINIDSGQSAIIYIKSGSSSVWNQLIRFITTFDASALTADATISSTVLSVYGYWKEDSLSTTPDVNIYSATPASNNNLVTGDYLQIGSTAQCDTAITYAGFDASGYNDFTFNATGRGNVSKTGISKFGIRNANYDVSGTEPNRAGNSLASYFGCYTSDYGSNKPKLVVTYTTGNDYFQTCSATISINDTLLNKTSRVFSEVISIVDSISIQKTLSRTLSEVITIVDNINAKKIVIKTLSDVISIIDTIKKSIVGKIFTETITISDSITTKKILNKILSDVITLVDTTKGVIAKNLSEAITIADSISKITAQVLSETITLSESLYMRLNGVNVKWVRKYSEKVGSFTRKYGEKVGTFIKKYYKDI